TAIISEQHYWCPSSVVDVRLRPDSPVVLSVNYLQPFKLIKQFTWTELNTYWAKIKRSELNFSAALQFPDFPNFERLNPSLRHWTISPKDPVDIALDIADYSTGVADVDFDDEDAKNACLEFRKNNRFIYLFDNLWKGSINIKQYTGIEDEQSFLKITMTEINQVDSLASAIAKVYVDHEKESDEMLKNNLKLFKEEHTRR
ncbi:unnamed protein product, partial [Rotaria sordida]